MGVGWVYSLEEVILSFGNSYCTVLPSFKSGPSNCIACAELHYTSHNQLQHIESCTFVVVGVNLLLEHEIFSLNFVPFLIMSLFFVCFIYSTFVSFGPLFVRSIGLAKTILCSMVFQPYVNAWKITVLLFPIVFVLL